MDYCSKGDAFLAGDVGLGKTYMKMTCIYRKKDRVVVQRKCNHWLAVSNEKWGGYINSPGFNNNFFISR
jgi:hypothetical protein